MRQLVITIDMSELEYKDRYDRQLKLKGFGESGQKKLTDSHVLVIGAGGLGVPAITYLVAAGVGHIGIVDYDVVESSNLHRQVLYSPDDIGRPKVEVAKAKLTALNSDVRIDIFNLKLDSNNALEVFSGFDVVLDGSDNLATRYLVNDACVLSDKALVYGSVHEFEGQLSVFNLQVNAEDRSCNYRDVFPTPPPSNLVPNCNENGVLGVAPGMIGTMMAAEAIKIISDIGEPMVNHMMHIDLLSNTSRVIKITPLTSNPLTGDNPSINELMDYEAFCGNSEVPTIDLDAATQNLMNSEYVWVDVRTTPEHQSQNLGGQNIPLDQIEEGRFQLDKNAKLILYCETGVRSARAVRALLERGFDNVYSLKGGVQANQRISQELELNS